MYEIIGWGSGTKQKQKLAMILQLGISPLKKCQLHYYSKKRLGKKRCDYFKPYYLSLSRKCDTLLLPNDFDV